MKVLVIDGSYYYIPFKHIGKLEEDVAILDKDPKSVALVVFTGGEDVDPSYYGEKPHYQTCSNPSRDEYEKIIFDKVLSLKIPMFGICRGSQFLCVMAGGKLHQHVERHGGYHDMKTNDGRIFKVNSTHHQMQIPPSSAKVLAYAYPNRHFEEGIVETECAYYPNINAVGVQYHPEGMQEESEGRQYAMELATDLLNGTLGERQEAEKKRNGML